MWKVSGIPIVDFEAGMYLCMCVYRSKSFYSCTKTVVCQKQKLYKFDDDLVTSLILSRSKRIEIIIWIKCIRWWSIYSDGALFISSRMTMNTWLKFPKKLIEKRTKFNTSSYFICACSVLLEFYCILSSSKIIFPLYRQKVNSMQINFPGDLWCRRRVEKS